MKKTILISLLIFILVISFAGCSFKKPSTPPSDTQPGDENTVNPERKSVPDFSWSDNGKKVKLSDLKGKVVLIDFWATWCGPCKMTIPSIEKVYEDYKNSNFVVIGVNLDQKTTSDSKISQFIKDYNINYTVLRDSDFQIANLYGVSSIPHFVLIDKNGLKVEEFVGALPNLDKILSEKVEALLKE